MTRLRNALLLLVLLAMASPIAAATPDCKGKFPDMIGDICWSCIFPIRFAGVTIMGGENEDTENPGGAICTCTNNGFKIGVPVSFWEPSRTVEMTRTPFCMPMMGGIKLDPGINVPAPSVSSVQAHGKKQDVHALYHSHWYIMPLMWILEVMFDNSCIERTGYDLAYMTELDPTWTDNELTMILNPDSVLFANPITQIACAADAVAATAGFPLSELFWCAGSQGGLYPIAGQINSFGHGVRAAELTMQRMTAKMHREGLMWGTWGEGGMCGYYPQIMMNKRAYKSSMVYPKPQTEKDAAGRCCQPYGRTTALWGSGREFPYEGEDFAFMVFRKRNCCQGAIGTN